MGSWLQKEFSAKRKVRNVFLTFLCIFSLLLLLLEVWRNDLGSTLNNVRVGPLSAAQTLPSNSSSVLSVPTETASFAQFLEESAEVEGETNNEVTTTTASTPFTTSLPVALPTRPAIIAAAVRALDLAWMKDMRDSHEIFPYIVTDRNADPRLAIPANKGREAMVYLSYLIDNYDKLPPYAIFTHGHRRSWHQPIDIEKMIRKLRVDVLEKEEYISFRCSWSPSCPAELRPVTHDAIVWGDGKHVHETEDAIADAWPALFPEADIPQTIASPCCAQFAVTRSAMMRRSKEDYSRLREWLLRTKLDDQVSGRVFEKLWAYIMTDESVQ